MGAKNKPTYLLKMYLKLHTANNSILSVLRNQCFSTLIYYITYLMYDSRFCGLLLSLFLPIKHVYVSHCAAKYKAYTAIYSL